MMSVETISLLFEREILKVSVPRTKLVACVSPRSTVRTCRDPMELLRAALRHPTQSAPLREMARERQRAVIVVDDSTRPVPTPAILDVVIPELQEAGLQLASITVVVATGLHKPPGADEMSRILGSWHGRVSFECHDARDSERLVTLGRTRWGNRVSLNRTYLESDLRIVTGDVELHQFCGYGGGAKSVFPGLADADSIRRNHSRMKHPLARPGVVQGNPVREEIEEVGEKAGMDFLVSVVLDVDGKVAAAYAGSTFPVFQASTREVDRLYSVQVSRTCDLVIASAGGDPRDRTLYQAQKALESAQGILADGGEIILFAACGQGSGADDFDAWMEQAYHPRDIATRLEKRFLMGGHKAWQVARVIERHPVSLFSRLPPGRVRAWMMHPLRDMGEVEARISRARYIAVIPSGATCYPQLSEAVEGAQTCGDDRQDESRCEAHADRQTL